MYAPEFLYPLWFIDDNWQGCRSGSVGMSRARMTALTSSFCRMTGLFILQVTTLNDVFRRVGAGSGNACARYNSHTE